MASTPINPLADLFEVYRRLSGNPPDILLVMSRAKFVVDTTAFPGKIIDVGDDLMGVRTFPWYSYSTATLNGVLRSVPRG